MVPSFRETRKAPQQKSLGSYRIAAFVYSPCGNPIWITSRNADQAGCMAPALPALCGEYRCGTVVRQTQKAVWDTLAANPSMGDSVDFRVYRQPAREMMEDLPISCIENRNLRKIQA